MRSRWLLLPLLLLSTAVLMADSVTLKTGETVTGTIKNETDTEVTIDVAVSASITDERVIEKADIAKIDKAQADQIAYSQLSQMQPDPQNSYASATYAQILAALNAFAAQYPTSAYLPAIQKQIAAFQEEKSKVDAGQIKYLGQWLTVDQAAKRQIQIQGLKYLGAMKQQAAAGNLSGAMDTYGVIEKTYATTRSYPPAVLLARQILARYQQDLASRMQTVQLDQQQLRQTILATPEPDRSRLIATAKEEQDSDAAIIAASLKTGAKWIPLIPRSAASIETLQKTVAAELPRINAIPAEKMMQSIDKVDAARAAIDTKDYKGAADLLADANALWQQNEAAHYWSDQLKAKLTAVATPSPTAAAPKPAALAQATPPPAGASAASTEDDASKPFYMTIPGAIAIALGVLIVGGGIAVFSQRKGRQAAAE